MKSGSIVLIDDSKEELFLCNEIFHEAHYPNQLISFMEAPVALKYIIQNPESIFLILCDINMPRMSGFDVLAKINEQEEPKLAAIPFIFLSNSRALSDINNAFRLKAKGYFQKPWNFDELSRLLNQIITYWELCEAPDNYPGREAAVRLGAQLEFPF